MQRVPVLDHPFSKGNHGVMPQSQPRNSQSSTPGSHRWGQPRLRAPAHPLLPVAPGAPTEPWRTVLPMPQSQLLLEPHRDLWHPLHCKNKPKHMHTHFSSPPCCPAPLACRFPAPLREVTLAGAAACPHLLRHEMVALLPPRPHRDGHRPGGGPGHRHQLARAAGSVLKQD